MAHELSKRNSMFRLEWILDDKLKIVGSDVFI